MFGAANFVPEWIRASRPVTRRLCSRKTSNHEQRRAREWRVSNYGLFRSSPRDTQGAVTMEFFVRACIPGASSPPFLRCAHMVALKGRKREGEKSKRRKKRTGRRSAVGREKERKNERGREGEKSVRTSLRGFSRPATYGNVIRAFRWMLSCVFALLRNHVVLPSRSTLPSSFFFPYLAFFAFSPQKESMSMRKRFVSMFLLDFRLMCPKETSKIRVYAAGDWHFPTLPSQRGIITFGFFRRGSILTRLWW